MGYRKEVTAYKLTFEAYDGLEVTVKSLSVGELLELSSLAAKVDADNIEVSLEQSKRMFSVFSSKLISWNLEDENGNPVPATLDGVVDQEMPFIIDIITNWMNEVSKVDENLGKRQSTLPKLDSLSTETLNLQ